MGGIYGCGCIYVVVRRYIDFLILYYLSLLLLYLFFFCSSIPTFLIFLMFFVLVPVLFCIKNLCIK